MKGYVCHHGINDADYPMHKMENGKRVPCHFYETWRAMLARCYESTSRNPSYSQCTVDPDWLFFSVFKEWMEQQDWQGRELDKDIIEIGNKHYSPETCCFVPRAVNALFNYAAARRGSWPQGVYRRKCNGKFASSVRINRKNKNLGSFTTPEAARDVYCIEKACRIIGVAATQFHDDQRIFDGLVRHAQYRLRFMGKVWDQTSTG